MKKADLITTINEAMERENKYVKIVEGDQNPQVVEMYNLAKGRAEAYEAVIHYIKTGSKSYF